MTPLSLHLASPFVYPCFSPNHSPPAQQEENKSKFLGLKLIVVSLAIGMDNLAPYVLFILGILSVCSSIALSPAAGYAMLGGGVVWGAIYWTWAVKTKLGRENFFS